MSQTGGNESILSGEYQLTAGIETLCITRKFTSISHLAQDAMMIFDTLNANGFRGNQWILVLGLTKKAIHILDNDKRCLDGITPRFEWDGTTGLIKVVPDAGSEFSTSSFVMAVHETLWAMGIPRTEMSWGGRTTYQPTVGKGKQGDQIFTPGDRQPAHGQIRDWPTLVLETGLSESLRKLQENAKWWFNNSNGRVRFVIVVLISYERSTVLFQKWQLVPPNAPSPMTRHYISWLHQQSRNMPPLSDQPAATQMLYMAQEVTVTPNTVSGAPMVLPFHALMDRAPGANETDISITAQDFRVIASTCF
ncbi:hypothetical protein BDV38DRAFT_293515 [Aspergillus pseudotamarii]|uniref:Uncharacterized protein n=1 Tax=Aspergillus pseudotamarii TaxID=132259 RepID=A0A5N6TA74_ASPPS|nr:uncharacterized protein BDV38DRAFT_293515 [Aspergillus pseudotamarii]KAE8143071.1 hypothetical protein BDV38DRAFT_293515 [Aspergillus pseudotamarii]